MVPLAGVTVHQVAFETAVQNTLAMTPTVVEPAGEATLPVAALSVRVGVFPLCVKIYVREIVPLETVMVADLAIVELLTG